MSKYIYVFDFDSTITAEEVLPKIAKNYGLEDKMRKITEDTMQGVIPFKESFLGRISLIKNFSVNEMKKVTQNIKLNDELANFIRNNHDRCYILTGSLDIFIEETVKKLNLGNNYFASKTIVNNDRIVEVTNVINKKNIMDQFVGKVIAVGDGNNDAEMIAMADVGIGFGGIRPIAPAVLDSCLIAVYDEHRLVKILESFENGESYGQ